MLAPLTSMHVQLIALQVVRTSSLSSMPRQFSLPPPPLRLLTKSP